MDVDLDQPQLLSNDTTSRNRHRPLRATLASFIVLLLASSSASAATLNVDGGGQLLGATGVIVDGSSYNVEFLDGTCIGVYSGCDEASDFTFQSSAAADLASQALLDQVFLDGAALYDSDPELTFGCSNTSTCAIGTAYSGDGLNALVSAVANDGDPFNALDTVFSGGAPATTDLATLSGNVYAVWSPVPEPGTAVLMGLGLLGLSIRNRREG